LGQATSRTDLCGLTTVVDLRTITGGSARAGRAGMVLRRNAATSVPRATISTSSKPVNKIFSRIRTRALICPRSYFQPYEGGMNPTDKLVGG
jgi:hypothetical protein